MLHSADFTCKLCGITAQVRKFPLQCACGAEYVDESAVPRMQRKQKTAEQYFHQYIAMVDLKSKCATRSRRRYLALWIASVILGGDEKQREKPQAWLV